MIVFRLVLFVFIHVRFGRTPKILAMFVTVRFGTYFPFSIIEVKKQVDISVSPYVN